jgi:hypothetical protein
MILAPSLINPLEIYQLRVVLKGVSPIIWRRILVTEATSIADLHYIFQIILEWSDDHLNRFIIHGKDYGVYHDGGLSFSDDPKTIHLKDFQFRPHEKFTYEYNFNDGWEYEIRFEKAVPFNAKIRYPYCLGGGRSAPPEDCGGPLAFLELDQHYSVFQIKDELIRLIKRHVKAEDFEDLEDDIFEDYECDKYNFEDGLEILKYWANRHKFNRRKINTLLQTEFTMNKEETKHAS